MEIFYFLLAAALCRKSLPGVDLTRSHDYAAHTSAAELLQTRNMKKSATIPFDFVLERLQLCAPAIRPMFGCHAVYVAEKLVLILRKKEEATYDNGVWLATAAQHHQSLKSMFPSLRSIRLFGGNVSAWQNIPEDAGDFEESAITACELILKNDPRIGKIPKRKSKSIRRH